MSFHGHARPTAQAKGDGRRRPLATLRKEYKSEYDEAELDM